MKLSPSDQTEKLAEPSTDISGTLYSLWHRKPSRLSPSWVSDSVGSHHLHTFSSPVNLGLAGI